MINQLNYKQEKNHTHAEINKCLFQPSIRLLCDKEIKTKNIGGIMQKNRVIIRKF